MKYTDQIGQTIELSNVPKRIISLVPSQSELLWDLGLGSNLVGITKFCIHPKQMFDSVERIGGTKQLNIEKIKALKPDLIIGNKEENDKQQIEELSKLFPIWMSDVNTLAEALEMIYNIGLITGKECEANEITSTIKNSFSEIDKSEFEGKSVAYLMWNKPYMVAANHTFINSMLDEIGLNNVFIEKERYPEISIEDLKHKAPQFIFLSTEPFPFTEVHARELESILLTSKIILVDGEMFSWYGSHLQLSPEYFKNLNLTLS